MKTIIDLLVHQAIFETISVQNSSPTSTRELIRYLEATDTRVIVYQMIIEHLKTFHNIRADRLLQTINLLKKYLPKYMPDGPTLEKLDRFFANIVSEDPGITRSVQYIRRLLVSFLKSLNYQNYKVGNEDKILIHPSITHLSKTRNLRKNMGRRNSWYFSVNVNNLDDKDERVIASLSSDSSDCAVAIHRIPEKTIPALLSPVPDHTKDDFSLPSSPDQVVSPIPVPLARIPTPTSPQSAAPTDRTFSDLLHQNLLFARLRTQVFVSLTAADRKRKVRNSMDVPDLLESFAAYTEESFKLVKEDKKTEETIKYVGKLTIRRKRPHLFHYKYYREQSPLVLSSQQMKKLLDALTSPPDLETRLIATKILIKLLIDDYAHNDGQDILSVLLPIQKKMLLSPNADTRIHSINLLFNLAIHSNMYQSANSHNDDIFYGESASSSTSDSQKIEHIQNDLFLVFNEMLSQIVANNETDPQVWNAALNLLLIFISRSTSMNPIRMKEINPRHIVSFINHINDFPPEQGLDPKKLIIILTNTLLRMLYLDGGDTLDLPVVKDIGLAFFINLYTRTRSIYLIDNLFLFLFDFIVLSLKTGEEDRSSPIFSLARLNLCLHIFEEFQVPLLLSQAFKYSPTSFWDEMADSIVDQARKQFSPHMFGSAFSQYDQPHDNDFDSTILLLRTIIDEFAIIYTHLREDPASEQILSEFRHYFDTAHFPSDLVSKLHDKYFQSPLISERLTGENILFGLFTEIHYGGESSCSSLNDYKTTTALKDSFEAILSQLSVLEDISPFLAFIERVTVFLNKNKATASNNLTSDDESGNESSGGGVRSPNPQVLALHFFSEQFKTLIKKNFPLSSTNVLYLVEILFDLLISTRKSLQHPFLLDIPAPLFTLVKREKEALSSKEIIDTFFELFLSGQLFVSNNLLVCIDIELLSHLFQSIPKSFSNPRIVLLKMIIQKCSGENSALENLGGVSFFWLLVSDLDPRIAYFSSRFVLDELERNRPEEFRILMASLLDHSRESGNVLLMGSPYLQVKAMIKIMSQENRKKLNDKGNLNNHVVKS